MILTEISSPSEEALVLNMETIERDDSEDYVTDNEILTEEETEEEEDIFDESIIERIIALQDAIPYSLKSNCSNLLINIYKTGKNILGFVGLSAWIISTGSAILLLPLAMEIEKEAAAVAQETQMANQQQQAQQIVA